MSPALPALLLALAALPAAAGEGFRIALDLDPDASARLVAANDWLTVEASFYGEAGPEAPEAGWGRASLGQETATVFPVSQTVTLGGSLAAMPTGWVTEPRVAVTVSSGAPGAEGRIVCDTLDQPLAALLGGEAVRLDCVWGGD